MEQLSEKIEELEGKKEMLQQKGINLFDCLLLRNLQNAYIPENERFTKELTDLLIKVQDLEFRR